ncbi:MAG: hypothetical protein AB8U69_04450 [Anaplasma ovis]|uniref:Uncharacterized protein n=1 Tax=Anaplasma ovis str. Haibei TaxID=1248439 RepID=A0A2Z2LBK0_9RICK|nr:hypothetical protein [Anaplasma ovis]ASI47646.1 hypothetical protein AOV_02010 [Anaplasma ovis str. Haibei]
MEKVVSHSRIARKYSPEAKRYIGLVLRHGTPGQAMIMRGILKTHSHARSCPTKVMDIRGPQKAHLHLLERYKVRTCDRWVARAHIASRKPLHCKQSSQSIEDIIRALKAEKAATCIHKQWQHRAAYSAKSVFKTMLKVKVAHGMDPIQRAGQTTESNIREAAMYGRALKKPQNKRGISFIFKLLINLLFALIFPLMFKGDTMVQYILKGLEYQQKEKEKDSGRRHGYACIAR